MTSDKREREVSDDSQPAEGTVAESHEAESERSEIVQPSITQDTEPKEKLDGNSFRSKVKAQGLIFNKMNELAFEDMKRKHSKGHFMSPSLRLAPQDHHLIFQREKHGIVPKLKGRNGYLPAGDNAWQWLDIVQRLTAGKVECVNAVSSTPFLLPIAAEVDATGEDPVTGESENVYFKIEGVLTLRVANAGKLYHENGIKSDEDFLANVLPRIQNAIEGRLDSAVAGKTVAQVLKDVNQNLVGLGHHVLDRSVSFISSEADVEIKKEEKSRGLLGTGFFKTADPLKSAKDRIRKSGYPMPDDELLSILESVGLEVVDFTIGALNQSDELKKAYEQAQLARIRASVARYEGQARGDQDIAYLAAIEKVIRDKETGSELEGRIIEIDELLAVADRLSLQAAIREARLMTLGGSGFDEIMVAARAAVESSKDNRPRPSLSKSAKPGVN